MIYFNILGPKVLVHWIDPNAQFERGVIGQDDFGMEEIKVYEWEGYGHPYSNAGSLSSLKSFGHVDDLEMPEKLIELTSRSLKMSDRFHIPPKYFNSLLL